MIEANGEKHYVKGGKPGYYPSFRLGFGLGFGLGLGSTLIPTLNLAVALALTVTPIRTRTLTLTSGFFNEQYWPHPLPLNLFDPFGFSKNASPEKKAKGLRAEINNGRLAMLGRSGEG